MTPALVSRCTAEEEVTSLSKAVAAKSVEVALAMAMAGGGWLAPAEALWLAPRWSLPNYKANSQTQVRQRRALRDHSLVTEGTGNVEP